MITDSNTDSLNGKEAEKEFFLLFTMTVALLVAVPCELVATALYSAVSLTAHLRNNEHIFISLLETEALRVSGWCKTVI